MSVRALHYRSRMELCNAILTLLGHNVVTACLKKYSFFQEILYEIVLVVQKKKENVHKRKADKQINTIL